MSSGDSQVVGYQYFMGLHLGVCHKADAIEAIKYGERLSWTGNKSSNGEIYINKPNLFGGKDGEGGIEGPVDVLLGAADQTRNSYLQSKMVNDPLVDFDQELLDNLAIFDGIDRGSSFDPNSVPAFRGVVSLVFKQVYYAARNYYIKNISVKVRRHFTGWNPDLAKIGADANPAHIIYECLTDTQWGMGLPANLIDSSNFATVAQALYDENFGLSFTWAGQSGVDEFVGIVCQHINASLVQNPRTGLFQLNLIRKISDPSGLKVFDEDNIIEMVNFNRAAVADLTNKLTVVYRETDLERDEAVTVQSLGTQRTQGRIVPKTRNYPGIRSKELALRVAQRDLDVLSTPLASMEIKVNRDGYNLVAGDAIKCNWPKLGLENVVFRIVKVDYGTLENPEIVLHCIEDVFSLPDTTYVQPASGNWQPPVTGALPALRHMMFEAPYYLLVKSYGEEQAPTLLDGTNAYVASAVVPGTESAVSYRLVANTADSNYEEVGVGNFSGFIKIEEEFSHTDTVINFARSLAATNETHPSLGYLDTGEWVEITARDDVAGTVTVNRGVLDSIPKPIPVGTTLIYANDVLISDTEYFTGETIYGKALITGVTDVLDESDTYSVNTGALTNQAWKPYPPANVRINTEYFPASITGDIELAWSHRDRTMQTAGLNDWYEGSIGPETNVTYTIRVYNDENNALLFEATGETGTSITFLEQDEFNTNGVVAESIRVEMVTVRDGVQSRDTFIHTMGRVPTIIVDPQAFYLPGTGVFDGTSGIEVTE